MSGAILGPEDTAENRTDDDPYPHGVYMQEDPTNNTEWGEGAWQEVASYPGDMPEVNQQTGTLDLVADGEEGRGQR